MPLYAFIYILLYFSFILKISYMHSLIILSLVLYYILLIYLLPKVSYIYFTYRIRARGFGWFGRFRGRFRGFGRVLSANRSFYGRRGRIACACGRVFPCVRARGYAPTIFCARPIPGRLLPHSVRRWYRGNRVVCGAKRVRVPSECAYCIIFSA